MFDAEVPVNVLKSLNRELLLGIPAGVGRRARRDDDFSASLVDVDDLLAKELKVPKKDVLRGIPI